MLAKFYSPVGPGEALQLVYAIDSSWLASRSAVPTARWQMVVS